MKYRGVIKKSRTIDFGVLVLVFGVIQASLPDLQLSAQQLGIANMLIGVLIVLLRAQTTAPVGEKDVE